jgi:hypothetical protein
VQVEYPFNRFSYDTDATEVYVVNTSSGSYTKLDDITTASLNGISSDALPASDRSLGVAFLFPEVRAVQAALVWSDGGGTFRARVADYTSLASMADDSSWTDIRTAICSTGGTPVAACRQNIQGITADASRLFMVDQIGATSVSSGIGFIHLFGEYGTYDHVEFYDELTDKRISPTAFDFGDVSPGTSVDRLFRVRNASNSFDANDIVISTESVGAVASPSVDAQYYFSTDGEEFASTVTINELAPGQVSGQITIRQVVPSDAQVDAWGFRVNANVTTWS